MTSPTLGAGGDLPKGYVTPYAYFVKWVIREREGSKFSKNGRRHL